MRNKAPLAMMEQVVMLLVFALAAALCLQAFAAANERSKAYALRDEAAICAQTAAETMKYAQGDWTLAADLLDGTYDTSMIEASWSGGSLTILPTEAAHPLMEQAAVTVLDEEGAVLFTLPVAWQKGGRP